MAKEYSSLKKLREEKEDLKKSLGLENLVLNGISKRKKSATESKINTNETFQIADYGANFVTNRLTSKSYKLKKHRALIHLGFLFLLTFIIQEVKGRKKK